MTDPDSADSTPKLRGYLLYALGEIALVVIGILIALQIGERAEIRSQEGRVEQILMDVRDELETDVAQLDAALATGALVARSVQRVLDRDVTREDYRETRQLGFTGFYESEYSTRRTAWSRLSSLEGTFPSRYEEVRGLLDEHYEGPAAMIDTRAAESLARVIERRNRMIEEQRWGWRLLDFDPSGGSADVRNRTDEMIDWYLESDQYRGWVAIHRSESPFVEGSVPTAARLSSIAAWVAISTALGEAPDHPMIPEGLVVDDLDAVAPWFGLYRAEGDSNWDGRLEVRGQVLHFVSRGGRFVQPMIEVGDGRYALPSQDSELTLDRDPDGETILVWESLGRVWIFRRTDR